MTTKGTLENDNELNLHLDAQLYSRLAAIAAAKGLPLEAYIVSVLEQVKVSETFEKRQVIGQIVTGRALAADDLVSVAGIYYRYQLTDQQPVDPTAKYVVIAANGNSLTLHQL